MVIEQYLKSLRENYTVVLLHVAKHCFSIVLILAYVFLLFSLSSNSFAAGNAGQQLNKSLYSLSHKRTFIPLTPQKFLYASNTSLKIPYRGSVFNRYFSTQTIKNIHTPQGGSNEQDIFEPVITNHNRTKLEIAIFIGAGAVGYNLWQEKMKDDWEFEYSSLKDYVARFYNTDQVKFDDNDIFFNWGHVYAGAFYYQAARLSGHTPLTSTLISLGASSFWEYIIEFREAISINDQIMTGLGGPILGESFHQMASLLKRRSKTILGKTLATYFQPIDVFHNYFETKTSITGLNKRNVFYYKRSNYEKFDFLSGYQVSKRDNTSSPSIIDIGVDGEVINLPVSSEGETNKIYTHTAAAQLIQKLGVSQEGIHDYYSFTKWVPVAYFSKKLRTDSTERKYGYSMLIGPSTSTEYNSRGFNHEQDFYAAVNLLGATLDFTFYHKSQTLRIVLDAYGNFAFVRPYGTKKYFESGNSFSLAKTVLRKKNYYYAFGNSLRTRIELKATNKLKTGLSAIYHTFESISEDSKDRHPDGVFRNLQLNDRLANVEAWLSYKIKHRWKIRGAIVNAYRFGSIDEFEDDNKTTFSFSDRETIFNIQINYNML